MDLGNYYRHLESIEREIVDRKLDTLVLGLGPTAWLLPWIDRKLLVGMRIWGAHDIERIWPVDDLVIMDTPQHSPRLKPGTEALKFCVEARPKRLWLYKRNAKAWRSLLHHAMRHVTTDVDYFVHQNPVLNPGEEHPRHFLLEWGRPHTGLVSPTGMTTLAWREGCRRIGVLGVEMDSDHRTCQWRKQVDGWFVDMARQAHEKGGAICNLSPISQLKLFRSWKPSASSSAPTNGSESQEPKKSSNTASENTATAPSK